jgi:hypothetical protein
MTDTMMIVLGVICVILALYIAVSIILLALMAATEIYGIFFRTIKYRIAKYREKKDER